MKKQTIVNLCLQCAVHEQQDGKTIRYAGRRTHEGVCEKCWDRKIITAYYAEEAVTPLREEKTERKKPLQRAKKTRGKTPFAPAPENNPAVTRKDEVTAVSFGGDSEKVSVKLDMSVRTLEILRDAADKWGISMGEAVGSALRFCMKGKRKK